jgi:hypothetical protein
VAACDSKALFSSSSRPYGMLLTVRRVVPVAAGRLGCGVTCAAGPWERMGQVRSVTSQYSTRLFPICGWSQWSGGRGKWTARAIQGPGFALDSTSHNARYNTLISCVYNI